MTNPRMSVFVYLSVFSVCLFVWLVGLGLLLVWCVCLLAFLFVLSIPRTPLAACGLFTCSMRLIGVLADCVAAVWVLVQGKAFLTRPSIDAGLHRRFGFGSCLRESEVDNLLYLSFQTHDGKI